MMLSVTCGILKNGLGNADSSIIIFTEWHLQSHHFLTQHCRCRRLALYYSTYPIYPKLECFRNFGAIYVLVHHWQLQLMIFISNTGGGFSYRILACTQWFEVRYPTPNRHYLSSRICKLRFYPILYSIMNFMQQ